MNVLYYEFFYNAQNESSDLVVKTVIPPLKTDSHTRLHKTVPLRNPGYYYWMRRLLEPAARIARKELHPK